MTYHDALAQLGILHAHPGGEPLTAWWMGRVSMPEHARILDVGCGNGATACFMAQRWNADVTVLDVRKQMVDHALRLAAERNLRLRGVVGSAEAMPFQRESFHAIVSESVLVFTKPNRALREYRRVIEEQGVVIAIEMMTLGPVTDAWRREVRQLYGAQFVPDLSGWKRLFYDAGFDVKVLRSGSVSSLPLPVNQQEPTLADPKALLDPQIRTVLQQNAQWMEKHGKEMGYGVFELRCAIT
ncbi:methyltransferase family protein [Alicyclobacillus sacchari]|uniref:Methyltransferase family protein n=1 Tax=Alicyclobacillus sacchari TaxID=392010 RepID=A0A4R8LJA4_9BACL|nr:class I SAM-dependent methyltransferase [Alicyclobacillus sacchari]TDY43468.1 methyltransferase family protein [Alicyclobacillus sacchari]GMA55772.1 putative methyltransferase YodH [Alicyclobacillus sacchari]